MFNYHHYASIVYLVKRNKKEETFKLITSKFITFAADVV